MRKQPHPAVAYLVQTAREKGVSLAEVERRAELGTNTISRWIAQGRTPDLDVLDKALAVFDLRLGVMTRFPL